MVKKVTIQDIAAELKLCRNTVAKALNDGPVAYETRVEVIKKAKEMGYAKLRSELIEAFLEPQQPEEVNKGTILVLMDCSESNFWKKLLNGVSEEITANQYRMQMHIVEHGGVDPEEICRVVGTDVKAIVLLCGFMKNTVKGIAKLGLPMTFFGAAIDISESLPYGNIVTMEAKHAVAELVETAIQEGKREFAFIGYAEGAINIAERLEGMMAALNRHKLQVKPEFLFTDYRDYCYCNYAVVEQVINEMPHIPEAIVCANDDIAKYVASALMKRDMNIAMQTTLIGYDNTIEGDFFKQDIMTVDVRKEEVGRRIVKVTVDQIMNPQMDHIIATIATYPIRNR